MKKLKNAVLYLDIPFNIAGILFCFWRINRMLHADFLKMIEEEGGIEPVSQMTIFGAVCCCVFLVSDIVCAAGRKRHKESMLAEGLTGMSFALKILFVIFFIVFSLVL